MSESDVPPLSANELTRLRALIDRREIDDCLARVARGTDRFDRDLFLSGFHSGAVISTGNDAGSAADTYEGGKGFHEQTTLGTLHCLSTSSCEIEGDTAHAETYHIYCARNLDETNWAAAGRYLDQFERRDGVWAIAFRRIVVEWTGKMTPNVIAMFEGVEHKPSRLDPVRSCDDVSYLRPLNAQVR
jgi:SnoaL-like domain